MSTYATSSPDSTPPGRPLPLKSYADTGAAATTTGRVNRFEDVMDAVRGVVPSPLPAIVFTSLASACVPTFSDRCQVLVEEDGITGYWIERPNCASSDQFGDNEGLILNAWSGPSVGEHTVQTHVAGTPACGHPGYRVRVRYGWDAGYTPTRADMALAQVAAEHAGAVINRERDLGNTYRVH